MRDLLAVLGFIAVTLLVWFAVPVHAQGSGEYGVAATPRDASR